MDSAGIRVDARTLWRAEQAERHLGLDAVHASMLACDLNVDICSARELVAKGCPPATAIELATREV